MCVPRRLARVYIVCTCVPMCNYVGICCEGFPSGSASRLLWSVSQEIVFYKVIDYILHGKEDIKVIP